MSHRQQSMSRRSPSILVTDARHDAHKSAPFVRTGTAGARAGDMTKKKDRASRQHYQAPTATGSMMNPQATGQFTGTAAGRFDSISIDNILSDVSEIPSAQRRQRTAYEFADGHQSRHGQATSPPLDIQHSTSKGSKRSAALSSGVSTGVRTVPPRLTPMSQGRTTKLSEKLVLIPEEGQPGFKFDDDSEDEDGTRPPKQRPQPDDVSGRRKSYAERVPKDRRTEQFARVTAYCLADSIRLKTVAEFLREKHRIRPRIYDEALFAPYYLPLLPGDEGSGCRVKSTPHGAVMEQLINESEQSDHHFEYFSGLESSGEQNQPEVHDMHDGWTAEGEEFDPSEPQDFTPPQTSDWRHSAANSPENGLVDDADILSSSPPLAPREEAITEIVKQDDAASSFKPQPPPNDKHAEIFIFTYGVIVFWNFTERQEKDVLADLSFARMEARGAHGVSVGGIRPLFVRPVADQDIETEELHFTYSPETARPRIYNDMITLKSGDHMIKLGMSHAIAQSTKLSRFEARMDSNMHDVKHVPRMLALTGKLGMKREEILKISGKLFKLRVDVNLSSNVLDTPEFFWEDEPSLNPLYTAVREYLEIEQRILVLNERCKVFLELTDIIADSIAEGNMSRITWIIIILIALSLGVSSLEIFIRFTILDSRE